MKLPIKYSLLLLSCGMFAQSYKTVSVVDNYNNWGWNNVLVAKNKFITVAVVPDAAGRMLQFDLGKTASLWVNPKLLGHKFAADDKVKMQDWRNFGGYRLVPTPVDNFAVNSNGERTKRWPPPVIMGDSPYDAFVSTDAAAHQLINVSSGIQNLPVPIFDRTTNTFSTVLNYDEQLQYKRCMYIEKGKSLVFITHSLLNKGTTTIERGLKITSQHPTGNEPQLEDGENFLAYIPISNKDVLPNGKSFEIMLTPQARWNFVNKNRKPLDKNNAEDVAKYFNSGTNWKGEVAPGVYELHYDYDLMGGVHFIAAKSWIGFVDKLKMTAFVTMFEPYSKKLNYEYGANAEIYNSGLETGYLETEIKTAIHTLKPGQRFDYNEIQAAAKIASTPILEVNKTGIITQKLHLTKDGIAHGAYGVFVQGKAIVITKNNQGEIIKKRALGNVSPLKAFTFDAYLKEKKAVATIAIYIKAAGDLYLLDSVDVTSN